MSNAISVSHLTKKFKDVVAVDDISFNVKSGEIFGILGLNGAGKTTIIKMISGLTRPTSGDIKVFDYDIYTEINKIKSIMGVSPQDSAIANNLSVKENIEVGAYLSDKPLELNELLKTLGLYEHRNKLPNQLSGGQQQRTAIGRAIIKNPDILLCDEPTGALDYKTSKEILCLIEQINQKYGNTVIMVTHNDAIKNMADRVVKLRDGQIQKNYINETKIAAADLEW